MPSPHDTLFPDDPDPVARWRREADAREEEFARQRAAERAQSKVQPMERPLVALVRHRKNADRRPLSGKPDRADTAE
jgi:hypothetical protein